MSTAFKTFIVVLSSLFMIVSGFSVILGFSDVVAATNYVESVSNIIVESHYNSTVITECIQDANDNGYVLTVSVTGNSPGAAKYAKIVLEYDFELKLFGYKQAKSLSKVV